MWQRWWTFLVAASSIFPAKSTLLASAESHGYQFAMESRHYALTNLFQQSAELISDATGAYRFPVTVFDPHAPLARYNTGGAERDLAYTAATRPRSTRSFASGHELSTGFFPRSK